MVTGVLPEDDPHGDRAWLAEQRRKKGRGAILDHAEAFVGEDFGGPPADDDAGEGGDDDGGDAGGGSGGGREDDAPKFDVVKIPRIVGNPGTVRWVHISLPDPCPITPLGKSGNTFWYLNPLGELVGLEDGQHGQAHIESLWSPKIDELHRAFPQFNQQAQFKGFAAQYARAAQFKACGMKGIFDAHERVRGAGCWKGDNGELIQHLGDRVLVGDQEHKPGEIDGYVYPGRPALMPPVKGGRETTGKIYSRLKSWNWVRGDLDARLLLGQQGTTVLGAALDWRPMVFLTGDAATGKSTLQRYLRSMLPRRLVATVDATEAALRGLLGQDSVGVSFDEIEADMMNDKAQAVMKLARTAASGDDAHRSSSSQEVRSFTLRGSFTFSAIIPPSMRQADMQRFAFLRLQTLAKDAELPDLTTEEARAMGAALVGRITDGWDRWQRTLDRFALALAQRGHAQRSALQFGTLLAAAHIILEDGDPDPEDVAHWCDQLKRDGLFEYENSEPAWLTAWRRLMSYQPEIWRADGFPTVAEMVRRYLVAQGSTSPDDAGKAASIHDKLTRAGLAIVKQRVTGRMFLAIPPKHQAIAAAYAGSDFQARGGEGAWSIPLRGAPAVQSGMGTHDRSMNRGVLHVDKVPRLDRQKCALFWLDGQAELGGVWTPIFERSYADEEIDAPTLTLEDRVATFRRDLAACTTKKEAEKLWRRTSVLRDDLDAAATDGSAEIEGEFNAAHERLP